MKYSERLYPDWFINELVNEEDKEKARNGSLMNKSIVEFRCNNGHIYKQKVHNHIRILAKERYRGCPICGKVKNIENRLKTVASKRLYPDWFISELVSEEDKEKARNGSLKTTDVTNFLCFVCGNIYKQKVNYHIKLSTSERKSSCPVCGNIKMKFKKEKTISSKRMYPQWFIDELANEEDKEKAINGSLKSRIKVDFICENGHIYSQKVYDHVVMKTNGRKKGCPICMHLRSKSELEIEEYVESLGYDTEHKRLLNSDNKRFEIDIFIPEKNVGIEYNGSYYHSIENERIDEHYHYNKFDECRKRGILLITIFDLEWEQKKEEIEMYIKDILEEKENDLSYNKDGYMNNNYPSWKYYMDNSEYLDDSYIYHNKYIIYTCGYSKIIE